MNDSVIRQNSYGNGRPEGNFKNKWVENQASREMEVTTRDHIINVVSKLTLHGYFSSE